MSTTIGRHDIQRRLHAYQRQPGNWRFKGLLLAAFTDAETVGEAWPMPPRDHQPMIALASRGPDTNERAVARSLYGKDAVEENEHVPRDVYISRLLTAESTTELDVLWRESILETVQAGAQSRQIARETTTVTPVEARKGTVPVHDQRRFAKSGAGAASASFGGETYTPVDFDCEKWEEGFSIQDELIEQSEVGVIEQQIQAAGSAVENAITRQYVTNCIDNAANTNSSVGNEATVQSILETAEFPADSDFDPVDVAVIHPELLTELADDPSLNYLSFSRTDVASDRSLQADDGGENVPHPGRAFGPQIWIASDATYNGLASEPFSTTNTYGWEAAGEVGGFVHGSPFVHTVVYRDIEVSELQSPVTDIRDVQGGVARAYTDSVQPSNDAIASLSQ